jgi:hypothetical protein
MADAPFHGANYAANPRRRRKDEEATARAEVEAAFRAQLRRLERMERHDRLYQAMLADADRRVISGERWPRSVLVGSVRQEEGRRG